MKNLLFAFIVAFGLCVDQNTLMAEQDSNSSTLYKKVKYEASLAYTQISANDWWTKIEPFNIYLGALPLKNKGHLQAIADLGVTHVLSVVEDFEMEDGWFNSPVTAEDWKAYGIAFENIPAVDFSPLSHSEIETGVDYLARMLGEGHTVYVHCKAGRGRSATIVIVYLMQFENLSFDDAFALVKEQRPQINLNDYQRQAIFDYFGVEKDASTAKSWKSWITDKFYSYFQSANDISEEKLSLLLGDLLYYVIEGVSYSSSTHVPEALAGWVPDIDIESTMSRRDRYLREYMGDQEAAVEASIKRNHNLTRRFKLLAAGAMPFIGVPTSYSISLWHQLREIALIAALHGHDLKDPIVKMKILSAVVGGNLLKIPAVSVDLVAKQIVRSILVKAGIKGLTSSAIPAHLIFNYFTENSAKVSTHAKELFAGENSLPIPAEEYMPQPQTEPLLIP